ncbi:putative bifunctional diguanylate cyclase/phosphodiesterase [Granulosicoccus antarcticus]|uniref:Cyclic di-GMP phosphodiesterase PdeB n=1 Tax=Granulosicoccus antarcticus IMCC3135 TaxID=1192854 RepID=A0A2Z2NR65_9GAMM|nr:EAL domain-containing protein [Granulosicoccus antarcticus]ASJ72985.1 Cyclic di-GMP phosphodiesterase PdeB [Granulosicoccus antarcticus IMCC3135]
MFSGWRLRGFTLSCLVGLVLIVLAYQNTQVLVKNWLTVLSVSQQEWNWQATALVREHLRFVVQLENYINQEATSPVELEQVVERFDLYWSRYSAMNTFFTTSDAQAMALLSEITSAPGDIEDRLTQIVGVLNESGIATLRRLEPILMKLQPGDIAAFKEMMQGLRLLSDNAVDLETALFARTRTLQFAQNHLTETLNSRLRIAYIGLCLVIFTLVVAIYAYVMIKNRTARSLESVNSKLVSKISESEELTNELKRAASHDSLTGLLNRHGFELLLGKLFQNTGQMHGLCFVDLDMFKVVNDTCGHAAGDRLIQEVADLFTSEFEGRGYVARFGGDEFVLVLSSCEIEEFNDLIMEVSKQLSPYRFNSDQQIFEVTASFGALHFDAGKHSKQSVMAIADAACYEAKNSGGGRVYFHDGDDSIIASRQSDLFWINAVQQALKEDRYLLYYQPIVGICEQGVCQHSWEILVRMCDEKGGVIPPGQFLEVAERYGMAPRIDRWVVQHAFDWLDRNCLEDYELDCLNINLSGLSVSDLEFLSFIEELTRQASFDPGKVCFELTETAVAGHKSREFLLRLKEMGYQLALDDFGSGFASFGYLETLPVDYIKIDGQFVKDVDTNSMHREFVKAIGAIGKSMGKKVVAEFVENEASLDILRDLKIDYAQGYHIARPMQIPDEPGKEMSYQAVA